MGLRNSLFAMLPWLREKDLRLAAELALLMGLVFTFLTLGSLVAAREYQELDERLLLALRAAPDDPLGPPWVEAAMMHLSALGSGVVTGLFAVIAVIFLGLSRRRSYGILVAVAAIGCWVAMWALKSLYQRPRPTVVTHIDPPGGLSFPSGHSMISAALYLTFGVLLARALPERRLRVFALATGVFLALLVGFTRVYLGVHYPSDVIGGWTVGLCWALLCGVLARRLDRPGTVPAKGDAP